MDGIIGIGEHVDGDGNGDGDAMMVMVMMMRRGGAAAGDVMMIDRHRPVTSLRRDLVMSQLVCSSFPKHCLH